MTITRPNRERDLAAEVDEELEFHLEMRARELIARGVEPEEARRRAATAFGDIERTRARYVRRQRRAALRERTGAWITDLLQDLRFAVRQLGRNRGFATIAVVTLALGIGVNASVFTVVDSVLLRPLPYPDAGRIVRLWGTRESRGVRSGNLSPPDLLDYAGRNRTLAAVAGLTPSTATVVLDGVASTLREALVQPSLFDVVGVEPLLGRRFTDAEATPGGPRAVIATHGYWLRALGADPSVLGRTLRIDGEPHEVVGVLPPELAIPTIDPASRPELIRPLRTGPENGRGGRWLRAVARLAPGADVRAAGADLGTVAADLRAAYPDSNEDVGVRIESLRDATVGDVERGLWILQGAVLLVLLIACVNVANLLTVRGAQRHTELSIRTALGAGRARLVRQLGAEAAVLVALGGAGGALAAVWATRLLAAVPGAGLPRVDEISVDASVLAFCALTALGTGVVFSLAPMVQIRRSTLRSALASRTGLGGASLARVRTSLVSLEAALAIVLLVGAGLLSRSFLRLVGEDAGIDPERTTVVEVTLPPDRYDRRPAIAAFYADWLARLADTPGFEAVGAVNNLPFLYESCDGFGLPDRPEPPPDQRECAVTQMATPGYFAAAGIALLEGRELGPEDREGARRVAVVNASFAGRYWPGISALGRMVTYNGIEHEIVGVSAAVRRRGLAEAPPPELFLAHAQDPWERQMFVLVRSDLPTDEAAARVRASLREADSAVPIGRVLPMSRLVSATVAEPRFRTLTLGLFALLSAALAGIGIYGVMSFSVAARAPELGLRLALGAGTSRVRRAVLAEGLRISSAGLALGLLGAILLSRLLTGLLYEVDPVDPTSLAAACAVLLGVATLGAWIPARRATATDPLAVLRRD